MKNEKKALLIRYITCFVIASLMTVIVFWSKGFFSQSASHNVNVLADGFSVSGALMTLFAGMLFISGEGGLLGIGFILRNVVLAFIPMGRMKHEVYADYRERKLRERKKAKDHSILVVGLLFLFVGIIFNVIWYAKYYGRG